MSESAPVSDAISRVDRQTVADYASALASGEPTPGGGSAASVVGALAASLAEMVCNLTLARPSAVPEAERLVAVRASAAGLRERLLILAQEDEEAYGAYRAAVQLPKSTPTEQDARRDAIDRAVDRAADVPLAVAEVCLELLRLLDAVARFGTRHARSDTATSAHLAHAALASAAVLVRANADLIRDPHQAGDVRSRIGELESASATAYQDVLRLVEQDG